MRIRYGILGVAAATLLGASAAQAEITIGFVSGLSGQIAALGQQSLAGAQAAVADINAKGGVLGEPLVLDVADDACEPKQAVAVANQMASKGVPVVIGHLCSGATIPASEVYAEEGIVMITASATNPTLTDRGFDNVFRAIGRDDQQGAVAAAYIADRHRDADIAIIHDKQAYGKGIAEEVQRRLREAGIQEAIFDSINPGERDFSALITRLKQAGIDVVYYGGYHPELGLMVRQAREQGLEAQFVSDEGIFTQEYAAIAGQAAEGTLITYPPNPKDTPAGQSLTEQARQAGTPEPDNFFFGYYAAVQVLAQAAEQAGSMEPDALIQALRDGTFDTVIGQLDFDEKGDLTEPKFVIYELRDGEFVPVYDIRDGRVVEISG